MKWLGKNIQISLLIVVSFMVILAGMNVYQYLRVKTDIAPTLFSEVGNVELGEIRSYFNSITEQLSMVREWGENGVLVFDNTIDFNKFFFPLLDNQISINSIVIANNIGDEYFLYRDGDDWITRVSRATDNKERSYLFTRWISQEESVEEWQKDISYDPRDAAWFFVPDADSQVRWSPLHTFMDSQEYGVTPTVSWKNKSSSGFSVFGFFIPLNSIKQFIVDRNRDRSGIMFLFNDSRDVYVASGNDTLTAAELNRDTFVQGIAEKALTLFVDGEGDRPEDKPLAFMKERQRWMVSFHRIDKDHSRFWLGVATPEKEFIVRINSELFKIDLLDIVIASVGTGFVCLLLWKTGRFRKTVAEPPPIIRLTRYINRGEGAGVEFKSTVRVNLKTEKHGKEIELAWLKAVVAFLNSDGGALLIGVEDSGSIAGIDRDGFENRDKSLLHVKNLINHHVGAEFSSSIRTTVVEVEEKEVMMVECSSAPSPVFLKIGKNEEFYIRSGPSSTKLSLSQTIRFITQK